MKRRALIALALVTIASAAGPEDDRDKLRGTWVCTWMKVGRFSGTAKGAGDVPLGIRFEGDHYVEFNGNTSSPRGSFSLDPAKSPKQMDLTSDDPIPPLLGGPKGQTTLPCIYEIQGDRLTVCMGVERRPKAFVTRWDLPDTELPDTVLYYKRVEPTR